MHYKTLDFKLFGLPYFNQALLGMTTIFENSFKEINLKKKKENVNIYDKILTIIDVLMRLWTKAKGLRFGLELTIHQRRK